MSIYQHRSGLSELAQRIQALAMQGERADHGAVRFISNHKLSRDASHWWLNGSKCESYLEYAEHHGTLGALHAEIDPVISEVQLENNYSSGEAYLILINLTHMKALLMAGSGIISGTHYEYEVITGSNNCAYCDDLVSHLIKARNQVFE